MVRQSVLLVFRHINTVCQPKHYSNVLVGEGRKNAKDELGLSRHDICIQTKFTSLDGQDSNNIPYNQHNPLDDRVNQLLTKILEKYRLTILIAGLCMDQQMRGTRPCWYG